MKRGFVLTESEKIRIKNIYNRDVISEATAPIPTDTEVIKKFEDWMDEKYPNWVTLNRAGKKGNVKKSDGTYRGLYGKPDSPSFKRAWDKYGDEFTTTSSSPTDEIEYGYKDKTGASKYPKTKSEMESLIDIGEINIDSWILVKPKGGKWEWKKAKDVDGIDFGPGNSPDTPVKFDMPPASADTPVKSSSYVDQAYGSAGTNQPSTFTPDPFKKSGSHEYTVDGFKDWYKTIYKKDAPATSTLDPNTKTILVQDNGRNLVFSYNSQLNDWNGFPQEIDLKRATKIVTKNTPKPDKTQVTAAPTQ